MDHVPDGVFISGDQPGDRRDRAPDVLGHVHDRSPVVIPPELRADWLDPELTDPNHVRALLAAAPPPRLEPHRVSSQVNDPRSNGPHLVEPVAG
jgi:putative SOS response-associated peptidase YedK